MSGRLKDASVFQFEGKLFHFFLLSHCDDDNDGHFRERSMRVQSLSWDFFFMQNFFKKPIKENFVQLKFP